MDLHPKVNAIDVSGVGGIWLFLVRGQKTAIIDTGPKEPLPIPMSQVENLDRNVGPVLQFLPPVLEKLGKTLADIDLISMPMRRIILRSLSFYSNGNWQRSSKSSWVKNISMRN
jgi:hypothetical protein